MKFAFVAAVAATCLSAVADTEFNAKSYVQDGLIIQYDAIDNEGTGTHNPNATVWKNIAVAGASTYDCTLSARGSWSDDGKSFACAGGGYAAAASALAPNYHTVESCFNRTSGEIMMNATKNLERYIVFSGTTLGFSWFNNSTENLATPNVAANADQQYAATYEGSSVAHIFKEGVRLTDENLTKAKFSNLYSCSVLTIGSRQTAANEHPWVGKIHTIRLYDRVLTDDELLFNANVDKIRFENADPETLTWPTGCRWNAAEKQLEFFVLGAVPADEGGTVTVSGVPADGAWLAAGSEVRFSAKAAAGKMFGGFEGHPYASRTEGDDLIVTVGGNAMNLQLHAVFHDKWAYPFPKDGLVVDLDATRPDTMTTDANGRVSAWRSIVGGVTFANESSASAPIYDATRNGGPGVWFGCAEDFTTTSPTWLIANNRTTTRTLIMVFNLYKNVTGIWRLVGHDEVIGCTDRWNLEWGNDMRAFYYKSLLNGGVSYLNGVAQDVKVNAATQRLTLTPAENVKVFFQVEATDGLFENSFACKNTLVNLGTPSHGGARVIQMMEVLIYDRKLSDSEREFILRTLNEKWGTPPRDPQFPKPYKNRVKVWTNASGDGDWGNGANWFGGLPASNEVAVVEGEEVKVKTRATFTGDLKFLEGASLDIAGGTVNLTEGTVTDLPPGTKIETGSRFDGSGTVRLGNDVETDTLTATRSTIDLNGHDLTVRSLAGGVVTNSSAEASTLTVAPTDDAPGYLNAHVREGVAVARGGSSEQECVLAGYVDGSNGTAFGAGPTRIATNECPVLEGCTMHLDASAKETFVFGDRFKTAGYSGTNDIVEWHSRHDPSWMVKTNAQGQLNAAYRPWYDPQAFGGKGGVRFKLDPIGGTNAHTRLYGSTSTKIVTSFFVLKMVREETGQGVGPVLNNNSQEGGVIYDNGWSDNSFSWELLNCAGGDAWMDGEKVYDAFAYETTGVIYTNADIVATWPKENFGGKGGRNRLGMYHAGSMSASAGYRVRPAIGEVELLAVRRKSSALDWQVCISDLPHFDNNANHANCRHVFPGWIAEIITYDRILTDEEFNRVQRYLYDKWMPPPRVEPVRASNTLSTGPAAFAAGAALDLGGTTQTVAKATVAGDAAVTAGALEPQAIETQVAADGSFGALALDLGLDLTDIDFAFVGARTPRPTGGTILSVNEQVAGPFKSVVAPKADELRYRARRVTYGLPGLLLFVQ